MKKEQLLLAIRQLIKAEVKKAVTEEVSKAMGKVLVEMVKEIKANDKKPMVRDFVSTQEIEDSENPEQVFTKNPKLNSVLAETARNFRPLQKTPDSSGLAAMMDGDFEKIGRGETAITDETPATKLDFLKQMVGNSGPAAMNQPSALDGGDEVPDMLKKVFKKDFRTIMKRIDEQKKGTAPTGYIDPRQVLSG